MSGTSLTCDKMAEILKSYVQTNSGMELRVDFDGDGNDRTGTMVIPRDIFANKSIIHALKLTGGGGSASISLVNNSNLTFATFQIENEDDMIEKLKMILPIRQSEEDRQRVSLAILNIVQRLDKILEPKPQSHE